MIENKFEQYQTLKESLPKCVRCPLYRTRIKSVWGEGNDTSANVMFVGEAPGKEENALGRPFIGKSGQLLRGSLLEYGFDWNKIFVTNTICCRPPGNRVPTREERNACNIWLSGKILFIKPKAIIAVGKTALSWFLGMEPEEILLGDYLRKPFKYGEAWVLTIYHPAFALRGHKGEFNGSVEFATKFLREEKISFDKTDFV
jgi:uracil-DNA glycosylase family 4